MNNVVQAVVATTELLVDSSCEEEPDLLADLQRLAKRMAAELSLERVLHTGATYKPEWEDVEVAALLEDVRMAVAHHPAARNKLIRSSLPPVDVIVRSDKTLMERILTNMTLNALEATAEGGTVELRADVRNDVLSVVVRNEGVIPEEVRPRVFQRYFSTKSGIGRGHGTFAMRMLGEEMLGGTVFFTSNETEGTRFVITLPLDGIDLCQ